MRFEILRMNIFIIETALFWSIVSTKPPSAPSESLFQMEFKQRLKIEKISFQYGLFSLKTNLTKVNITQIPTTELDLGGTTFIKIWTMSLYADLHVNKNNLICSLRVSVLYWSHRFVAMTRGYKEDEKTEPPRRAMVR